MPCAVSPLPSTTGLYMYIYIGRGLYINLPVLRSAKRAPAKFRRLNNISDIIFYCLVGERSRALALLNATQLSRKVVLMHSFFITSCWKMN